MAPVSTWLVLAALLMVPPLAVVGLVAWARRLRQHGAARSMVWTAYGVAAVAGLVIVAGMVPGIIAAKGGTAEPSGKARALAEGISEAMNCGVFALLLVLVGVAGLQVWRWWERRRMASVGERPSTTATESAQTAYAELTALWEHLPSAWTHGKLTKLHAASRSAVIALFEHERGLAELVHRFFEDGLVRCTSEEDLGQMPIPTNLSSLLALLRAEYTGALSDSDLARAELQGALSGSTDLLIKAAEPQIQTLALLVERILSTIARLGINGARIVLPELPVGNSIACKILKRALSRAGYTVEDLRISLPRNDARKNGVRRIDVLAEKLEAFGLRTSDLVLYVDEWESGSNFAAICECFERCLAAHPGTFLLPAALLRADSKDREHYERFVKKHDERVAPFGAVAAELRIVVPPIETKFSHRSYFFWSEHDRTSGYRKMQFLGSLYSSFDAAIEDLHRDHGRLSDALGKFLEHAQHSGHKLPDDMTGAADVWRDWFSKGYEDWVACRPKLEAIGHRSNLADVESVEGSLRQVVAEILRVVKGRPAEKCLTVAAFYERQVLRVSIDPQNRYHFKNHAAVIAELEGDHRLFHELLMQKLSERIDSYAA